eukprot:3522028-Karenia_brevis.AAC.1
MFVSSILVCLGGDVGAGDAGLERVLGDNGAPVACNIAAAVVPSGASGGESAGVVDGSVIGVLNGCGYCCCCCGLCVLLAAVECWFIVGVGGVEEG